MRSHQPEVMTPDHSRWDEFIFRLATLIWNDGATCSCGNDHFNTIALLKQFGADVPGSLARFFRNGGYCDCEILSVIENNPKTHPNPHTGILNCLYQFERTRQTTRVILRPIQTP